MISEVTGVFLECDPHAGPNGFDSCLFKQVKSVKCNHIIYIYIINNFYVMSFWEKNLEMFQDQDDDLDFDENGIIHERGLASVTSMPTWQWGER